MNFKLNWISTINS